MNEIQFIGCVEFVSFCGLNMLMFTYPEIKLSFPLANTHTMMGLGLIRFNFLLYHQITIKWSFKVYRVHAACLDRKCHEWQAMLGPI